jgi:hypothetical protein
MKEYHLKGEIFHVFHPESEHHCVTSCQSI